ncbi:MAG TPA: TonB-dependent receptor, partial [Burkholderiales bacterium]
AQRSLTFSPRARLPFAPFGFQSILIVGFDWGDWNYNREINAPGFPNTSGTQQSTGAYVQYNAQLTAATKLTLGAREQRVTDHRISSPTDQSQTQKPHAEEFGLSQALSEHWQVYGKLGTSFRVANVDENGFTLTGNLLKAQTARHREAGIEYRPPGAKLRASFYQIDLDNEIYFSPIVVMFGANTNLSPTRRRGAELSGLWSVTPTVDLAGSFAYQVAKFRTGVYGGVDVSGKDVPLVPRQLASLRLSWRAADKTIFGAAANFVGHQRYDNDQDNSFPRVMPAYALVDIKLTKEWADWQYSAAINNLFDKKYFNYGVVDTFNACGTPTCVYPQAGRVFFASAEHAFR